MLDHFIKNKYQTQCNDALAKFMIAKEFLPKILSPVAGETRLEYLLRPGASPFFHGALVQVHPSLCAFFMRELETAEGDSSEVKKKKECHARLVRLIEKDSSRHKKMVDLYEQPEAAHKFVQKLVKGIGTSMKAKRQVAGSTTKQAYVSMTDTDMALSLALKPKFRDHLVHFVGLMFDSGNLCETDQELIKDAIKMHNDVVHEQKLPSSLQINLQRQNILVPLIGRRNEEFPLENQQRDPRTQRTEQNAERRHLEVLAQAVAHMERVTDNTDRLQTDRFMRATAREVVDIDDNDDYDYIDDNDDYDYDKEEDAPGHNPYVDDIAEVES